MPHHIREALTRLATGTSELLQSETLRYADPGERNVVSELHVLLRAQFPEWHVSNEYDRREQERKRLVHWHEAAGAVLEADITPDLVVHRIGARDNLLVVEVKRHTNPDLERDRWKLAGMTAIAGAYGYAVGVHLILNVPAAAVVACDVYRDGTIDGALTAWLRERMPG